MHEAYEVSQLLKLQSQIESIAAYDDNLLIGTRQGELYVYSVIPSNSDSKNSVEPCFKKLMKTFSRKPVQQLEVIPNSQLLVSLSDNIISVHDINQNFTFIQAVPESKGCTLFALDIKSEKSLTGGITDIVRMCVAVKRKLQLYYWKHKKTEFVKVDKEIIINDVPKVMVWCQESICIGFKGEYSLYQLNGQSIYLFPIESSRSSEPCMTIISDNNLVLGKEKQAVLVNNDGLAVTPKPLRWQDAPSALAWDEPYALGILNDCIEVQSIDPTGPIQVLSGLNKVRLIRRCKQGLLFAASMSQLWCIQAVEVAKQREILLNSREFQLAVKLTSISDESEEDKKQKIKKIQTFYARYLFENKEFSAAMKEFYNLGTNPYEVIRLFPELLPLQTTNNDGPDPSVGIMKLQDKDLENGYLALIDYLTEVRPKLTVDNSNKNSDNGNINDLPYNSKSPSQLLQIIDTTLIKCFLQTNDALIASVLRLKNCHLGETERILKKHHKYNELIILYQTKGQHKKALELLQKQAQQPDSSLRGPGHTKKYLQDLGAEHINLVLEFAGWVLDENPEEGLKIFTGDIQEEEQLQRPKVLDYLLKTHKSLVIPYLEHVINVWKDENSLFHNALVHQYREKLEELDPEHPSAQHIKSKLLTFLETSAHYTPETVLQHFPYKCLFEERAVILGKLKRYEQTLAIYVRVIGDVDRAVQFCNKVYQKGNEKSEEVYIILIKMLLSPSTGSLVGAGVGIEGVVPSPKTAQPDVEKALELLNEFADKIDPVKALAMLPDSVPLVRIQNFIEVALHDALVSRRRAELVKGLLYAENLRVQEMRLNYESKSILLTELNVCQVCKKRFGNQSAFARYPNGDIVHYSCQDKNN